MEYKDADGKEINATAHLRMYKDSVIWLSLTGPLGIEGIRAYITKDSVKLLNKQDKIYTARSVSYLQDVTELPLDLASLQNLLAGNPVFFDSTITSYSLSQGNISLLSTGDFFINLLTIGDADKNLHSSKLDDLDTARTRTCYLTYLDYENKKGQNFSTRRTVNVTDKKKLDIKLDFKQHDFNETSSGSPTQPVASDGGTGTAKEEQTIEVDTDLFKAKFSNRGAVLKSWELKRYTTAAEQGPVPVQLVYAGGRFKGPLSLVTGDQAVTSDLGSALYHVTQDLSSGLIVPIPSAISRSSITMSSGMWMLKRN